MTPVLIVVIAGAAIGLTIRSARRALAERDAVERHHHTLDALGAVAGRADVTTVAPPPPATNRPAHRQPRGIPWGLAKGAVYVAIVVLAAAVYLATRHWTSGPSRSPARAATAGRATTTIAPRLTPTTAGPPVVLVTSDSQQAQYSVQRSSVDLELDVVASCWVEIRTGSDSGPVVFAGTLKPGARRRIPTGATAGGVAVRLGNPGGVAVSMDGAPLAVPHPAATQPFTLSFQVPA